MPFGPRRGRGRHILRRPQRVKGRPPAQLVDDVAGIELSDLVAKLVDRLPERLAGGSGIGHSGFTWEHCGWKKGKIDFDEAR